ncbi:transposase [Zalerion maritima]|uniref:Transposase n=1 Tax=Zalerion maritima TaxID=339359 RepID=A0AAD5RLD1_9PEZI|nr:transposase [Zalerion maritima]
MSNERRFGDIISPNRQKGYEFSPEAKGAMLVLLHTGMSARAVGAEFRTDHKVVMKIKKRFDETGTIQYQPRSGRPHKLTRAERRYIMRMIRKDRLITWDALVDSLDARVSKRTIRRTVALYYKRKWKALERPKLDADMTRVRLRWCQAWLEDIDELGEMINSDEVSVQNKSSNPNVYAFRLPHEKYNKEVINQSDHVKPTISMMFWAGMWKTGRTAIITMIRDPNARRGGYSAWSYQLALRDGLLPSYDGTRRFQQDNAKSPYGQDDYKLAACQWNRAFGMAA